ncbi:hypothetical protein HMPREF1498_1930 [Fusobacterium sp. CM1]|nr:hypothetical protein HMPREF1498_1930 [Fusobacterium sp. CM1]
MFHSNTARFAWLILFNFYPKIWNVTLLFLSTLFDMLSTVFYKILGAKNS